MWLLPVTMSTGWAAAAPYLSGRPSGANSKSESTLIWPRLLSNCCYCPGSQCSWDFCVLPLRVKSISHSLSGLLKLSPACLQSHVLWYLVFLLQDPQARGPDVGPRTLTPVGELLQYYSPVYGLSHLRVRYLIVLWIHALLPVLLGFLLYDFGCRRSFLAVSVFFIDDCSEDSCDFDRLMRRGEHRVFLLCHLHQSSKHRLSSIIFLNKSIKSVANMAPPLLFWFLFVFKFLKFNYSWHNILLASGVQHCDSAFIYVMNWSPC